jgi:hypothetical protein
MLLKLGHGLQRSKNTHGLYSTAATTGDLLKQQLMMRALYRHDESAAPTPRKKRGDPPDRLKVA